MTETKKLQDNPRRWTKLFTPPPAFDIATFQKKIDEICGFDGEHRRVRLVWGASEEVEKARVGGLGQKTQTVRAPRYQTRIKGLPHKVRINRWILEQWTSPEELNADEMFVRMPLGGLFVPPELAEMKRHGKWTMFNVIADHSKCEAARCASTEYYCFGDYKEPSDFDLLNLRRQTKAREEWEAARRNDFANMIYGHSEENYAN